MWPTCGADTGIWLDACRGSGRIVNLWSTTKMVTALCVLMLHDRGVLSVDAPMADYWPEFAANGKEEILVRHVLGHTAGLPVFDELVDDLALFDWAECCRRLAAQAPRWAPGDELGYHSETQGWLLGELVRRVDGRTLGTFFRDEVARPLGLDLHIGLADREFTRVADVATLHARANTPSDPELQALEQPSDARSAALVNTSAWRRAEFPASNAHGNARSIALAMAPLANDGHLGNHRLLSPATIERTFEVQADGVDRMTGRHFKLGIGYGLNSEHTPLGVNDRTLWWAGWGRDVRDRRREPADRQLRHEPDARRRGSARRPGDLRSAAFRHILKQKRAGSDVLEFIELFCGMRRLLDLKWYAHAVVPPARAPGCPYRAADRSEYAVLEHTAVRDRISQGHGAGERMAGAMHARTDRAGDGVGLGEQRLVRGISPHPLDRSAASRGWRPMAGIW